MLKPIQIIFLSLVFISGCANHNAAAVKQNENNNTTPNIVGENHKNIKKTNTNTMPSKVIGASETNSSNKLPYTKPLSANNFQQKPLTSIKAGKSTAIASGFTTEDGSLKPDILEFALEVSETKRLPQAQVIQLIKSSKYNERAYKLMTPAKTRIRKSWFTYENRFVEPIRIKAGVQFWQDNKLALQQVQDLYGVDAAIIVAIIGVETIYGRYMGDFKILDALATLGFRYPDDSRPERSQMFRNQLADLMDLHFQGKLNANTVTGSFAGAMGLPQFMPTSIINYAVDGDNDGIIDLTNSSYDAIASVASFLRYHGWQPSLPVFVDASFPSDVDKLVTGDIDPSYTWQYLQSKGLSSTSKNAAWQSQLLGIVDLIDEPRNTAQYRLATPNFFAITHYNRSYFYASAVYELAKAIQNQID